MLRISKLFLVFSFILIISYPNIGEGFVEKDSSMQRGPKTRFILIHKETQKIMNQDESLINFKAKYGNNWEILWDEKAKTPLTIMGEGIPVNVNDITSEEEVIRWCLNFIKENSNLLKVDSKDVKLKGAVYEKGIWFIDFSREYKGIPVYQSRIKFRIKFGNLILFGSQSYPNISINLEPKISNFKALQIVKEYIRDNDNKIIDDKTLIIYPKETITGFDYHLAWRIEILTKDPYQDIVAFVDAENGEILEIYDGILYAFMGNVKAKVDRRAVGGPIDDENLPNNKLILDNKYEVITDEDGNWQIEGRGSVNVNTKLNGPRCSVYNYSGTSAYATYLVTENVFYNFLWEDKNSHIAERDTFRGVEIAKSFAGSVFVNNKWIPKVLNANVNIYDICNAFWDPYGGTINFFQEGGGCNNTGRILDIILHEFGHGLDQNDGVSGLADGSLSEFIGDLMAFAYTGSSLIGPSFYASGGPEGGAVRDVELDLKYPNDCTGEVHQNGLVLGSTVWDARKGLIADGVEGQELIDLMLLPILHAAYYTEWYEGMLIVDDDDGNLNNGTPHACIIWDAFNAHSSSPTGSKRWPIGESSPPCASPKGKISFTKNLFKCDDIAQIVLRDSDLKALQNYEVSIVSTTEQTPEIVKLKSINPSVGHFVGEISLKKGEAIPNDKILQISDGDTIYVTYHDQNDGTGNSQDVTASGNIDCIPPIISDVSVKEIFSKSAKVTFLTNEDAVGKVIFGTDPSSLTIEVPETNYGKNHIIPLEKLIPGSTYYFDIEVKDLAGNISIDDNFGNHYTFSNFPPEISINPTGFDIVVEKGKLSKRILKIRNESKDQALTYRIYKTLNKTEAQSYFGIVPTGMGGPDNVGYIWIDSEEKGGPEYDWIKITRTGTRIKELDDDDVYAGPFDIGFEFPFYGKTYTKFYVDSNGWISFNLPTGSNYNNTYIPSREEPNNMIAAFWDDLNLTYPHRRNEEKSAVYYKSDGNQLVISYENAHIAGEPFLGEYSFQIILNKSGEILLQYAEVGQEEDRSTVGIENEDGTVGLQVIQNGDYYIKEGLAILIKPIAPWLTLNPSSGTLLSKESQDVTLTFDTTSLSAGTYFTMLAIMSTDPNKSAITLPIKMTVVDSLSEGILEVNSGKLDFYTEQGGKTITTNITLTSSLGDDNPVYWEASSDVSWISFSPLTGKTPQVVSVIIDPKDLTTNTTPYTGNITFTQVGSENKITLRVTLHVLKENNSCPVAVGTSSPSYPEVTKTVMLDGTQSYDPDGDLLLYYWVQTGGPIDVNITNPNDAQAYFTTSVEGEYSFTLTVSDGIKTSEPYSVIVYVSSLSRRCGNITLGQDSENGGFGFIIMLILFPLIRFLKNK